MKTLIGADIKLDWINSGQRYKHLEEFAASFDHKLKKSIYPLVAFRMGEQPWHGYAQIYTGATIFSAWHTDPKICGPRKFAESMKAIIGWLKFQHGGGFAGVPMDTQTFTPEVMKKIDARRCNCELYEFLA